MLGEVQDGFHNLLEKRKEEGAKIGIVCFYETLPLVRFLVVPKESAVISGELDFPLRANHTVNKTSAHACIRLTRFRI